MAAWQMLLCSRTPVPLLEQLSCGVCAHGLARDGASTAVKPVRVGDEVADEDEHDSEAEEPDLGA